ncbi:TPA: cell wall-binding repeat-containing protein [Clostridioides difficile]|uniref:cell wall-binding repeat-containing protein n=1 Tax=Clostridioides difficile TaxID=1496 RepID=UPI0007BB2216|nr:cell wall-binding repeat-containing protein [Clostridioides difficile]EGT4187336.1 cell wall-binding repeat-containing protein [Clostridioides difficile]EGT4217106.1 cell wall-binding repeat-containing protein [Clostridioides difficile]MCR1519630.1 cell wall-binding repeat-containing protein [Clostridioides difficile]CZR74363.1 cell surface protein [Clostridium difficile BI1] [Clostridioides difficile]CZR88338.1 N-acetylmuramoyl-L-alanine amidase LytC precursor [Clostridioides difficile]
MKISKKIVALLTITFLTITLYGNTSNASTKDTLTGSGRWETAIKISQAGWKKSENAVLVNDNSIADALSATPFAKAKDAPILLTQSNKLDSRTKAELKRLGVKNVYLIGGSIALSSEIEKQLNAENINFERISGNSRYDTSLKLAEKLDREKSISKIVVVNGEKGLADAVSVGAIAAQENMPIILSDSENGTEVADNFIDSKDIEKSYVIGGTYSISNSVERSLPNATRIAGSSRSETNAKIIEEFYKDTDIKNIYVTKDGTKNKNDLIDSLAVGVLASKNGSPILLAGNKLDSSQKDVLNTKIIDKVTQIGGLGNEDVVDNIIDIQEKTKYTVETIEEFYVAMKKADANDVIIFETKKDDSINDSFEVKTTKAITVEFDGIFKKTITIDMPNGDVNNFGEISDDIRINNIRKNTLINEGSIQGIDIYSKNGCKIENKSDGDIWLITIVSEARGVYIVNDGDISKISNSCSDVIIKNSGKINLVTGTEEPAISGKKPITNDTEYDDERAHGLSVKTEACSTPQKNYIIVTISSKPKNSNYAIYYRVVGDKPSAMYVGEKINPRDWYSVSKSDDSFIEKAKNGSYIEVVEINSSNNRVSRWGRSSSTDDGL